jgi:hypothetical protein
MSHTLQGSGAQVVSPLSELAQTIRTEHSAVIQAANDVLTHALAAGRAWIEAQRQLPKNQRGDWLRRHCDVSERHARRYAALVRAYEACGHSVSETVDLSGLSLRGLMRQLTPPKKRKQGPSDETKDPATIAPLNSLSWATASSTDRAKFVNAIGWQTIGEVIPDDWRPAIEEWLHPKPAPLVIDPDGHPIPEDLEIPAFLKVVSPDGVTTDTRQRAA